MRDRFRVHQQDGFCWQPPPLIPADEDSRMGSSVSKADGEWGWASMSGQLKRRKHPASFCDARGTHIQGCQMVYFQTKNPNLGKFWRVLQSKMLAYCIAIWSILWAFGILWPIGIFHGHLIYFSQFWYI
jgi:hypothetical protein